MISSLKIKWPMAQATLVTTKSTLGFSLYFLLWEIQITLMKKMKKMKKNKFEFIQVVVHVCVRM
jgi:hypothetical protein